LLLSGSWSLLLFAQESEDGNDRCHDGQELDKVDQIDGSGHPDFQVANLVSYRLALVFYERFGSEFGEGE
jgi:hypothetical protein